MPAPANKDQGGVSTKNLRHAGERFEAQADYVHYDRPGPYWDYVNAEIVVSAVGGFLKAKFDGARFLADADSASAGSWSLRVEEHFGSGELVSLRFAEYANYGGAHPSGGTYTKNFGGPDCGKLLLSDLFDNNSDVLEFLKQTCEADVKRQLKGSGDDIDYDLDPFLESDDPWELFAQWNFSPKGLLMTLSEYSGLPHVMGEFDVLIPWDFFRDKVSEAYLKTPIGRLIVKGA